MSHEIVDFALTDLEKKYLREQVAAVIKARLEGGAVPDEVPESAVLKEKRGAFVTLKKGGDLRGCIGYIEAFKPLYQTIREMASAAAFNDPRFSELTSREWPEIEIELSVLTPLREIDDPDIIEVGKHGLLIRHGNASGLLLPQVAVEYGWSRDEFLAHTCHKAGLAPDCWRRSGTKIYIFSADIF
ncbi:MAG: AmmeMemoRadiSam system protein A [Deltaproteobacteria bacterium]|nr:AmmeMemoRadiSam system protein A [Candidatus Tharpella sp.]